MVSDSSKDSDETDMETELKDEDDDGHGNMEVDEEEEDEEDEDDDDDDDDEEDDYEVLERHLQAKINEFARCREMEGSTSMGKLVEKMGGRVGGSSRD